MSAFGPDDAFTYDEFAPASYGPVAAYEDFRPGFDRQRLGVVAGIGAAVIAMMFAGYWAFTSFLGDDPAENATGVLADQEADDDSLTSGLATTSTSISTSTSPSIASDPVGALDLGTQAAETTVVVPTTAAPTTAAPTTAAPTTAAPTTAAPTTAAPTTAAPTTAAPTTAAPTTAAPTSAAPTTAAPTTAAPTTAAPTTAAPTTAAPTTAAPTTAAPTTAAPTTAAPTTAVPTTAAPTTAAPPSSSDGGVVQQVLDLTNQYRADNGCGPLQLNDALNRAATAHSADMAARDYFSHTNPDGEGPSERARAAGYPGGVGENIAGGYRGAQAVMDGWMDSPGHRANILNCGYQDLGVGYYADGFYWTQKFGRG